MHAHRLLGADRVAAEKSGTAVAERVGPATGWPCAWCVVGDPGEPGCDVLGQGLVTEGDDRRLATWVRVVRQHGIGDVSKCKVVFGPGCRHPIRLTGQPS